MPGKITGSIRSIDSSGNLVTDITAEMLRDAPRDASATIRCDEHETIGIFSLSNDQPKMTFIALIGAGGRLELSIVGDSAAEMLGIAVGEKVTVAW